jgi:hypothetical protein
MTPIGYYTISTPIITMARRIPTTHSAVAEKVHSYTGLTFLPQS